MGFRLLVSIPRQHIISGVGVRSDMWTNACFSLRESSTEDAVRRIDFRSPSPLTVAHQGMAVNFVTARFFHPVRIQKNTSMLSKPTSWKSCVYIESRSNVCLTRGRSTQVYFVRQEIDAAVLV